MLHVLCTAHAPYQHLLHTLSLQEEFWPRRERPTLECGRLRTLQRRVLEDLPARQSNTRPARSSSVHLHRSFAKQAACANVAQVVRQSSGRTEERRPRKQHLQLGRKESLPRLDMFCTCTCRQTKHLHCPSGNTCKCFECPNARPHAL